MNKNKQTIDYLIKVTIISATIIKVNDSFYICRAGTYLTHVKKFKQVHFISSWLYSHTSKLFKLLFTHSIRATSDKGHRFPTHGLFWGFLSFCGHDE